MDSSSTLKALVSEESINNLVNWMHQPVNVNSNSVTCGQLLLFVLFIVLILRALSGDKK